MVRAIGGAVGRGTFVSELAAVTTLGTTRTMTTMDPPIHAETPISRGRKPALPLAPRQDAWPFTVRVLRHGVGAYVALGRSISFPLAAGSGRPWAAPAHRGPPPALAVAPTPARPVPAVAPT